MCSHYQAFKERDKYIRHFVVEPPWEPGHTDMWPQRVSNFIRRHPLAQVGDEAVPALESLNGVFGLIPHWSRDTKIARNTYNARSETVAEKPSFRDAWRRKQRCIIPAQAIYEIDSRNNSTVPTKVLRADGEPMGIAGLWAQWKAPTGEITHSFTMLTVNADDHPIMKNLHKIEDEKRMVVILDESDYCNWLDYPLEQVCDLLKQYSADKLLTEVEAKAPVK